MADKEKLANQSTAQGGGLFLLEVLIDKVLFLKSPCFSDKDFRTCVTISAAGVEPLEICDDDPGACVAKSGGPFVKTFNSGKSCLFSLQEADITKAMNSFPVKVVVHKSLPCGCLPTKIIMGIATIDITKEFIQSRNKFLADPVTVNCQALKDTFQIVAAESGEHVGDILMFLRISCFGKLIITRFQGGNPSTLGSSRPGSIVDRSCNPQRQFQTTQDPCVCGAMQAAGAGKPPPGGGPPCQHGGGHGGGPCPITQDPYNSTPCQDPDDICYCSGPRPTPKQPMVCRNMDQYCLHVPKGPTKQFEEIGSTLGGNELKIKIPANLSIIKKISQTHCAMQSPYTKKKTDGPCIPPCGKNKISLALPSEATCCGGLRPQGTQFTCTTEACTQAQKHGQQAMLARGDTKNGTPVPNKDVFVLKVAKTAVEGDTKCKLELELVTPKGPDKMQPVRKVDIRCATDPEYCCPTGNKVIFQMPSDTCAQNHKQRAHFHFTSEGVGDVARDEPGQLVPTTAEEYPGVVYDYPHQIIKLRIGKVVEMPGRKTKFEYQFITPAATREKVVPVRDTRTAQCLPTCSECCGSKYPKC